MARISGKDAYIEFKGVEVTTDYRSWDWDESIKLIDVTAGNDDSESHVTGTTSVTMKLTVLYKGTDGTAAERLWYAGNAGTITGGPEGTAAGKPKYSAVVTIEKVNFTVPYAGEVLYDISLTRNGDWIANWNKSGTTF